MMQVVIRGRGRGHGRGRCRGPRGGGITDMTVGRFEYRPIAEASVSKTFPVDKEGSLSFPVSILESFPIASQRVASLDDVEGEKMMGPLMTEIEEKVELIQAPIPNFFMDDYVMIESELAHDETWWGDYLVSPTVWTQYSLVLKQSLIL